MPLFPFLNRKASSFDESAASAQAADETWAKLTELEQASRLLNGSAEALNAFSKSSITNTEQVAEAIHQIVTSATLQASEADQNLQQSERLGRMLEGSFGHVARLTSLLDDTLASSTVARGTVESLTAEAIRSADMAGKLSAYMNDLLRKSQAISGVIELLADVSGRIQLLSLNASIEAARAGDSGRGFQVVANEIRKLSVESETGSRRMQELLKGIKQEIEGCEAYVQSTLRASQKVEGVVADAGEAFRAINANLNDASGFTNQVRDWLQMAAADQEALIRGSHHVASLAQESLASATEVASLAENHASSVLSIDSAAQDLTGLAGEIKRSVRSIAGSPPPANAAGERIRIGFIANVTHAPALLANRQGLFDRAFEGRFELRAFQAGPALVQALANQQIDIGYTGPGPVFDSFLKSGDLRVVAGASQGGAAFLVRGDSGIAHPSQLLGATVAIPQFGSSQHILLRHLLRGYGMKDKFRGGSIRIIQAKPSEIGALFRNGEADAALVQEPWVTLLSRNFHAKVLFDWQHLFNKGRFPNTIVAVGRSFMERSPSTIDRFLQAHDAAIQLIQEAGADTVQSLAEELERWTGQTIPAEYIRSSLERIVWTRSIDLQDLIAYAELSKTEGFLKGDIAVARLLASSL